jgi:hypothetical protein
MDMSLFQIRCHDNSLPRECVSTSRCLAMAVFSDSTILAFSTMSHYCDLCSIVLVLSAIHWTWCTQNYKGHIIQHKHPFGVQFPLLLGLRKEKCIPESQPSINWFFQVLKELFTSWKLGTHFGRDMRQGIMTLYYTQTFHTMELQHHDKAGIWKYKLGAWCDGKLNTVAKLIG